MHFLKIKIFDLNIRDGGVQVLSTEMVECNWQRVNSDSGNGLVPSGTDRKRMDDDDCDRVVYDECGNGNDDYDDDEYNCDYDSDDDNKMMTIITSIICYTATDPRCGVQTLS